jgi:TusA-related sulfurtransferase
MATNSNSDPEQALPTKFESVLQLDVPKGRDGKHKKIVTQLLTEIEQLAPGSALKVPISALPDTKENIRAALNRATRQRGIEVATSSDEDHLYIWKTQTQS